jgi:hypothetical protein
VGKRNAYRTLVGMPDGKIPLQIPWHRWVNNTEMDLRGTERGGMDWIHLIKGWDKRHGNKCSGCLNVANYIIN